MDGKEILDQCVKVYGVCFEAFGRSLKAEKRYGFAKKVAALQIKHKDDVSTADKLIRDSSVYDPKHPEKVAAHGLYPLMGLALNIYEVEDLSNPFSFGTREGTLVGYFAEFCMNIKRFMKEVEDTLEGTSDIDTKVSRIFHKWPDPPIIEPKRLLKYKKKEDKKSSYEDAWYVQIGRCRVMTWKFGEIHQCVVDIQNPGAKIGDETRIGFAYTGSADSSLEKGIVWAEEFEKGKISSVEGVFADCFDHWPTLYQTRTDVINHLFFTIGGGYDWINGGIINTGPEDHLESRARDERRKEQSKKRLTAIEALDGEDNTKLREKLTRLLVREEDPAKGPHPEDDGPRAFYPACEAYSNICRVPDDVQDDWLKLSYEAALMLRDRSKAIPEDERAPPTQDEINRQIENVKLGTKVVKDLEKRFGKRLGLA